MVKLGKQNRHQSQSIWIFEYTVTGIPWPLKKDFITSLITLQAPHGRNSFVHYVIDLKD